MIELDRHIEILLLDNDCVIIPGFGGFMAHYVEARKDERDHAFLPPMRTIGFNPKLTLNDSLLAQSYVEAYDISYPDAVTRIADETRELRQRLEHDGQYELNDIGVLRLNKDGNYEFEPCDAGILTPSLYGLAYFTYQTAEEVERKDAGQVPAIVVPIDPKVKAEDKEEAQETMPKRVAEKAEASTVMAGLWRVVAVASVAFIVFLLIPAPLANDTQMAQGRLDTGLLEYVMPKDVTTGEANVARAVRTAKPKPGKAAKPEADAAKDVPQAGYTIVIASKVTKRNAKAYAEDLQRRGYAEAKVLSRPGNTRVVLGHYETRQAASIALRKLRDNREFGQAWTMKY